ncbi:MAG: CPBP family intramembrane glutamic endopeptidase [Anaerolineae bacterium]
MPVAWLFVGALTLVMGLVAFATYRSGRLLREGWLPPANPLLSPADNLVRLGLILICIALGYAWGPGSQALGWGATALGRDLGLGAAAGLLISGLICGVEQILLRCRVADLYDDRVMRSILPANRREWIGVVVALLPAALLEELLFRSLPLGGLSRSIAPWTLMWPLALLFGLLHWPQGIWGVFGTTMVALALSALFLISGSLWTTLAAHYLINLLQLLIATQRGMRPLRAPSP